MAGEGERDRMLRKLMMDHAETRWLALRLDADMQDVLSRLRTMRDVQTTQATTLEGVVGILKQHSVTLDRHGEVLDDHTETLHRHTEILNQHSEILRQHSETLDEHGALLQEHTARFDSVDGQLRSLTQLVGQVLERLPERPAYGS